MVLRNADILDPKTGLDLVGYTASLGRLDTAASAPKSVASDGAMKPAPEPTEPEVGVREPTMEDPVPQVIDTHEILDPPEGTDVFKAAGDDTADQGGIAPLPDPVFLEPAPFPIYGTHFADTIDGTEAGDVIYALDGSDGVYGHGGHDKIDAGAGHDWIAGDEGNDWLLGQSGDDTLFGDGVTGESALDGNDFLDGGSGHDVLYGRGGDDWLFGGSGEDDVYGGSGDDTLIGTFGGRDNLYGGSGADAFLSFDDFQQHDVWDYSAAEGDTVEGATWSYNPFGDWTTVFADNGAAVFLLQGYNAETSGINLVQYAPEPAT